MYYYVYVGTGGWEQKREMVFSELFLGNAFCVLISVNSDLQCQLPLVSMY